MEIRDDASLCRAEFVLPNPLEESARAERSVLRRAVWPGFLDCRPAFTEREAADHVVNQTSDICERFSCMRSIRPNKAPEPTVCSVTPRAIVSSSDMNQRTANPNAARAVPEQAVAHL